MRAVSAEFSDEEVATYAVSILDTTESTQNWIRDTGLRTPVLIDSSADLSCWNLPDGELSLYAHFFERTDSSGADGPFPLQVVIDPDGTIAYISREHHPDRVLEAIRKSVTPSSGAN
jgi:peroxiredoxin